jgi:O-antigen/teichoic acid export membrane protein
MSGLPIFIRSRSALDRSRFIAGTKHVVRKLFRAIQSDYVMSLTDQAIVSGASFLMAMAVGRLSGPGELGIYSGGMSLLGSLAGVQESLICIPYTVQSAQYDKNTPERIGSALLQSVLFSTLIISILTIAACSMPRLGSGDQAAKVAWLLVLAVPCVLLREFARQNGFAHLCVARVLFLDASAAALQGAVMAALALGGHIYAFTAYIALCAGCGTAGAVWLFSMRQNIKIAASSLRASIKRSWRLGRWLFASQIAVAIQGSAAFWILGLERGAVAGGIYAACLLIVSSANPMLIGLGNVLMPRAVRARASGGVAGVRRQVILDAALLGAVMGAFCVLIWAFGDPLMAVFFQTAAYNDHGQILLVLGLGMLGSAVGMPASNALASLEHPHAVFGGCLFGATAGIVFSSSLAYRFGIVGAAYGSMAGHMVGMVGRWVAFAFVVKGLENPAEAADGVGRRAHINIMSILRQEPILAMGRVRQIRKLGEGHEAVIFGVSFASDSTPAPPPLAIKLYKPAITCAVETVQARFKALVECREALASHAGSDWTTTVPVPLLVSRMPLALVMTAVPGKPILQSSGRNAYPGPHESDRIACAVVSALEELWSRGLQHGDLNLENMLADSNEKTISLIDPSEPAKFCEAGNGEDPWFHASCDLGHLLYEEATNLRRFIGRRGLRQRRMEFVNDILCTKLNSVTGLSAKISFVAQVGNLGHAHFVMLQGSWSPRGLWRMLLKTIAARRIDRLVAHLLYTLQLSAANHEDYAAGAPAQQQKKDSLSWCGKPV